MFEDANGIYHIISVERYNESIDDYVMPKVYLGAIAEMRKDISEVYSSSEYYFIDARKLISRTGSELENVRSCMRASLEIENALAENRDVLVFCGLGEQRSVLLLTYWLSQCCGYTWDRAFNIIQERKSRAVDMRKWIALDPSQYGGEDERYNDDDNDDNGEC